MRLLYIIPQRRDITKDIVESNGLSARAVTELIELLDKNGVGILEEGRFSFKEGDKVKTALLAVRLGATVEQVSVSLGWKDFEDFTAYILDQHNFTTYTTFRLRKPRIEIDVLAVKNDFTIAIDCKHWRRGLGYAALERAAANQIRRSEDVIRSSRGEGLSLKRILPAIITMYSEDIHQVKGVPIVPVHSFQKFILQVEGHLDELTIVSK